MIAGFALIPLTFAVGFGIDYARAMSLQTQLDAAADAAALAAVAPSMILQTNPEATSAAHAMFYTQASLLNGYRDLQMTPTIVEGTSGSSGALGYLRKATVTYTAQSINVFGGILGVPTLTVKGTSTASAAQPPNVDFYLAMDNSPSMLLPATSDGINKIIAATSTTERPTGCAFACHTQLPKVPNELIYIKDTLKRHILLSIGYYTTGSQNKGVFYRWDSAANLIYDSSGNSMTSTSTSTSGPITTTSGSGKSQQTISTTKTTVTVTTYTVTPSSTGPSTVNKNVTTTITTTTVTTVGSNSTTTTSTGTPTSTSSVYDTGYWADGYWLTHNYGVLYGSPSSITLRKDDVVSAASQLIPFAASQAHQYQVTYRAQMFSFDWTRPGGSSPVKTLNALADVADVASYGSGWSAASVFPADDYWYKNSKPTSNTDIDDKATEFTNMLTVMKNTIPTAGTGAPGATPQKMLFIITDGMLDQPNGGGRYFGPMQSTDIAQCTAIKAKQIKIAILYTQYLPESLAGDDWSQKNVAPFLPAPPSPYPAGSAGSSDKVLTALKSCASLGIDGAPLVQTVTADDNITTALQQLFATALQTARLVQ